MKNTLAKLVFLLILTAPLITQAQKKKSREEFYQITTYHFSNAAQQSVIDGYLQNAYLPALHRQQIKSVGVFSPISNDTATDKRIYVIIPLHSLNAAAELTAKLDKDDQYNTNGKEYLDAEYKTPSYNRMEVVLLKSFPLAPSMNLPALVSPKDDRVYELRSYEGATEKIFQNKVKMFNEGGEISLFKRLNFNAVFYASVVAGCRMPNLMYMTSFENMADRDDHWKKFGGDPEWKKISALPEYQNNVSKNVTTLMKAAPYSDY